MESPHERLSEIEARTSAAHPEPWFAVRDERELLLYVESQDQTLNPIDFGYVGNRPEADAEFVAHARTDVPYLLAEVRRYRLAWLSARERGRRLRTMLGYADQAVAQWAAELDRVKAQRARLRAASDEHSEGLRSLLEMVLQSEHVGRTPEVQSALRAAYFVMSGHTAKQAIEAMEAQA